MHSIRLRLVPTGGGQKGKHRTLFFMTGPKSFDRRQLIASAAGVPLALTGARADSRTCARQASSGRTVRLAGSVYGVGTFDPALSRDLDTNFLMRQLHRGLMQFSNTLEPEPALAENVDVLDEGMRYRFRLRGGMRFSTGREIDAFAVSASLASALSPITADGNTDMLAASTYLGDIVGADDVLAGRLNGLSGVEVESDRSLVITLQEPSGTFLMRLCSVPASIVARNQHQTVDGMPVGPAGAGPFMIDTIEPDYALFLVPSATWYGDTVGLDRVEVRIGLGATNPFNLFQGGEIDLIPSLSSQLAPMAQDPAVGLDADLVTPPRFAVYYIAFGNTMPPLDDVHIRRALAMAFPVDRVARDRFQGMVHVPRGLIPQGMLGVEWPDHLLPYDPELAREELRKSRYGSVSEVPPIEIFTADVDPLVAYRDNIERELGLTIRLYEVAWSDFLAGLAQREYGAYSLYWGADYADPESMLWMVYGADSPDNYTGFFDPDFETLLDAARREVDGTRRRELYAKAEQLLLHRGACLPLYQDRGYTLIRRGVADVPVTSMGLLGLESVRIEED